MQVSVQVTGDAAFLAKLEKLDVAISNFSSALRHIGDDLVRYYSDTVFKSMGGVYGTPWMKLAPSTIAEKTKHYRQYAAVPLVATGAMQSSFEADSDSHNLKIDNPTPYFVYHQSTEPRSKLPRRQMLGVNNDVKRIIEDVIKADIHQKIGAL